MRGGPADRGGLKPGDILVAVDDKTIGDTTTMLNQIAQLKPGAYAKLAVVRGAQELTLTVKVSKRPRPEPESGSEN